MTRDDQATTKARRALAMSSVIGGLLLLVVVYVVSYFLLAQFSSGLFTPGQNHAVVAVYRPLHALDRQLRPGYWQDRDFEALFELIQTTPQSTTTTDNEWPEKLHIIIDP